MENGFVPLDSEFEHKDTVLSFFPSMFRVGDFMSVLTGVFRDRALSALNETLSSQGKGQVPLHREQCNWFENGVNCEILSPGTKGWQKGKVRIKVTLEFCPNEPEVAEVSSSSKLKNSHSQSLLDDVRHVITQDSK